MEEQNDKNPKVACIIALICLLAPIIFALILTGIWGYLSEIGMYWSLIIEVVLMAAYVLGLVTIIDIRIKHPHYRFGKVVMGMYITVIVIVVVMIVAVIWTAVATCLSCIDCINDCS